MSPGPAEMRMIGYHSCESFENKNVCNLKINRIKEQQLANKTKQCKTARSCNYLKSRKKKQTFTTNSAENSRVMKNGTLKNITQISFPQNNFGSTLLESSSKSAKKDAQTICK